MCYKKHCIWLYFIIIASATEALHLIEVASHAHASIIPIYAVLISPEAPTNFFLFNIVELGHTLASSNMDVRDFLPY